MIVQLGWGGAERDGAGPSGMEWGGAELLG